MDKAIEITLKDVEKLEEQILSILTALKNDQSINEADLLPIPSTPFVDSTNRRSMSLTDDEDFFDDPRRKRKSKSRTLTASQLRSTKIEMDSAPIPMDIDIISKIRDEPDEKYILINSSLFLIPITDIWIFGMTLINSSNVAQSFPELILNIIPIEIEVIDKPCRVFNYSTQITPLDAKQGSNENRNVREGIPFQDTFEPHTYDFATKKIQPGCQVLMTATFTHPLSFCDKKNEFTLIVSAFLNGIQLWSKKVPVSTNTLLHGSHIETTMQNHRMSILASLGQHKNYFKLKRLLSVGDKSPHKAVETFLVPTLGLQKIFSESTGIDTTVEVFATSSQLSMLWGLSFKIEKCFRNVNMIRCLVSARSSQQMEIFLNIFTSWLKKESLEERRKGLTGLSISPIPSNTEDKSIVKTLMSEIQIIIDLIECSPKWNLKISASSDMDRQWIGKFMNSLNTTDSVFMRHITNIKIS